MSGARDGDGTVQIRPCSHAPLLTDCRSHDEHMLNAGANAHQQIWEEAMKLIVGALLGAASLFAISQAEAATQLTIATVNNGDMIRMQKLTDDFTKSNPDITLQWVTLEEHVLRQKVTTAIATKGGQYDVLTI